MKNFGQRQTKGKACTGQLFAVMIPSTTCRTNTGLKTSISQFLDTCAYSENFLLGGCLNCIASFIFTEQTLIDQSTGES